MAMFRPSMLVFLLLVLMLSTSVCLAGGEVLFQEDFDSGELDTNKWIPDGTWSIVDGVLDIANDPGGWPVGYTVKNDFADFKLSADFKVSGGQCSSFVLRAQNETDYNMVQFCQPNDNSVWWHTFAGGNYVVDQIPIESELIPESEVWYSVKFVVEDDNFTLYIAEQGEELELANSWQNDSYKSGAIGFWTCCGEHIQYDNVLVTTVGYMQSVSPEGNLSTTWGSMKLCE